MKCFIKRMLPEEFGEVSARSKSRRSDPQIDRRITTAMRIQRLVASVTQKCAAESREAHVAILRKHKFIDQQMRKNGFIEVVTQLQTRICFAVQQTLKLK